MSSVFDRVLHRLVWPLYGPIERMAYRKFHRNPLGNHPLASKETYLELWRNARLSACPDLDALEKDSGFAIDREWLDNLGLQTQITIKSAKLAYEHGRLVYSSLRCRLRELPASEPATILETGTARGFSALCMAKALEDHGHPGQIVTLDILPHETPMYWNCIRDVGGPSTRRDLLADYTELADRRIIFLAGDTCSSLQRLAIGRIHFAFLDGGHEYTDVRREFRYLAPRQRRGDMIVFDDYTPAAFPGVVRAADEAATDHGYAKRTFSQDATRQWAVLTKAD